MQDGLTPSESDEYLVMLNAIQMERVLSWMHERFPLSVSDGVKPLCKREVAGSIPAGSTKDARDGDSFPS